MQIVKRNFRRPRASNHVSFVAPSHFHIILPLLPLLFSTNRSSKSDRLHLPATGTAAESDHWEVHRNCPSPFFVDSHHRACLSIINNHTFLG
jgi:hypothetical protein